MASFYVLTAPAPKNADSDTIFVRDGFSWISFLLPLPWLLFRRMWMIALLAVLAYLVTVFLAETYRLDALPVAFTFVLSLWTALEGGHARARSLERKGWEIVRVIAADRVSDAEEIYFAEKAASARNEPERPLPTLPSGGRLPQSTNVAALGLIGGR